MQVTSAPVNPTPRAANTNAGVPFTNNQQDPHVLPDDVVQIGNLTVPSGKVATESAVLENKKAIFIMGNLVGLRPDPAYKLEPNADGSFTYPVDHKLHTGANAFGSVAATVNKYNEVLSELTGKQIEWSFNDKQLRVSPETGEWPNAFYARQFKGVHFFDYKTTSTGDSGEVASHETGHAVLDAVHPGYLEGSGAETGAFHEAFGDALAMLMSLGNDKVVEHIVSQTEGGDLSSKRNALSDMGEGFGHALGREGGIRTSFNSFVYADPATLPEHGNETQLGREVHDLSRLWSGAFYDILDGIADANRAAGMSPKDALKAAGEEGWKLLVGQMEKAPGTSETTFKEMGVHLMAADAQFNGGQRQELIASVLEKRLLTPDSGGASLRANEASGVIVPREFTLDGALAGVKMTSLVDQSQLGLVETESPVIAEARKGAQLMVEDGNVLFADRTPSFADLSKPDGTFYTAFVAPDDHGQPVFKRVPIAVCDFSHGPDCKHDH
jgi:hypothetical protein